jgi:hydroxymethylpyrimidine/phosphomethylpyrimidine kinase
VLIFAASDPSCGAGAQADLLTIAALGAHPLTVITALTAQNSRGVEAVLPTAPEFCVRQAQTLLADTSVAAMKVSVLGCAKTARFVADILDAHPDIPCVLDPVLASGRGDALSDAEIIAVLRERIIPRADLVTPNRAEARILLRGVCRHGMDADNAPPEHLAQGLVALGARHVFLTGGDANEEKVENRLYDAAGEIYVNCWPRLPHHYHGSGCTLAAAAAACLAQGHSVAEAVARADAYTWQTLFHAYRAGQAQHTPQRLFALLPSAFSPSVPDRTASA